MSRCPALAAGLPLSLLGIDPRAGTGVWDAGPGCAGWRLRR